MILDGTLKDGEFKTYKDMGNGWVEEIDTNKTIKAKLIKENIQLKEQVAYLRRSCERKEETIVEQQQELVGLDTKIDKALKKINDYKIYCKENKGFTEYTDIEIEAIEPVLTKIENILKEKI